MKTGYVMEVSQENFNLFPDDFEVSHSIFKNYYTKGFSKQDPIDLSDPQKVLCYYFICEGLIDNSGFYCLLMETEGELNDEYIYCLELVGDMKSKSILTEINEIFLTYKSDFLNAELPPELNDESDQFDIKLSERIDKLEQEWYDLSEIRQQRVNGYFTKHKRDIIKQV